MKCFNFKQDNEYEFFQDFRTYSGIPCGVDFFVEYIDETHIRLIGDRYGMNRDHILKYNLSGEYGNGAIFVKTNQFPEDMLNMFKTNELKKREEKG